MGGVKWGEGRPSRISWKRRAQDDQIERYAEHLLAANDENHGELVEREIALSALTYKLFGGNHDEED